MRILSASEAIDPAWERAKSLFRPFKWGRSWKLAAVAYLAQMGALFAPMPLGMMTGARGPGLPPKFVALLAVLGVVFNLIALLFFILGSRLQFVVFGCVATRSTTVAPIWAKYRGQVWRWIGFKLLFMVVVVGVLWLVVLGPFRRLMEHMPVPGHSPGAGLAALAVSLFSAFFAAIFGLMIVSGLLTDFALPFIALENATVGEALRRFGQLVRGEPGEFFLYLLVKILLAAAFCAVGVFALILVEIASFIPFGIVGAVVWLILRDFGIAGHVLLIVFGLLGYLLLIAWIVYVSIGGSGFAMIFFQALALYFLGGRYPLLGDLLEPPMLQAPVAGQEPASPS